MALASSSLQQLRYIVESAFGTTPVAGNPYNQRMTNQSLAFNIKTETSKEIRSDRQTTDLVRVSADAGGDVGLELSYNEHDDWLEAALQGEWSVYGTGGVGTSFTGTFTTSTITAAVAPVGGSAFTTLAKGQWFKLTAPTHANDGKFYQVSKTVSPTSTVITVESHTPLAPGTSIASCDVRTSRLANAATQRSFSMEVQYSDITQFFLYRGMVANKLSLSFQSGSIVGGSLGFTGKDGVRAATTGLPGTPVASLAYDAMNAVSGVGQIIEGGSILSGTFIKSVKFDVDNAVRGQDAVGVLGFAGVASGSAKITGDMEVYLADGTLYDKFVNGTASNVSLRCSDGAGNGYVIQLPKIKYGDAKVNAGSMDQDVMLSLPFTALLDAGGTGKSILIDRMGVAAV